MKTKLAAFISVIGNPLFTFPLFGITVFFIYEDLQKAVFHSLLILAFFVPLVVKMYLNVKSGKYTDFDVSDQKQRQGWYIFAILLFLALTIILFVTDQPRALRLGILFSLILLVVSKLANFYIKASLHVSFSVYLAFVMMSIHIELGLLYLLFTVIIAWARLTVKRHSLAEVMVGYVLGLVIGVLYFFGVRAAC